MIEFSLGKRKKSLDGKYYIRPGLIFEAGEYKDKNFSMTAEELKSATKKFKPVNLDYEHIPGPLDGKLGSLEQVTCSDDGEKLYGAVKIPVLLEELMELKEDEPIKVSCTWDKETKTLAKLALTNKPRVSEAKLVATFAANEVKENPDRKEEIFGQVLTWFTEQVEFKDYTWDGKDAIQSIHNTAARYGAICEKDAKKVNFVSKEESKAIQAMHDMAIKGGAKCNVYDDSKNSYAMYSDDTSSGKSKEKEKGKTMKINLKDLFSSKVSANLPDAEVEFSEVEVDQKDKQIADLTATVAGLAAKIETLTKVEEFAEKTEAKQEEVVDEEKEQLKKDLEAFKIKAAEEKTKNAELSAAKFADDNVKKILPKNREAAIALFTQLQSDDETASTEVKFNVDKKEVKLSRADAFKQFVESLPEFNKDNEVFGNEAFILGDKEKEFSAGDDTDDELLASVKAFAARENARLGK